MVSKSFPCETHALSSYQDLTSKKWSLKLLKILASTGGKRFDEVPPGVEYFLAERGKELTQCHTPGAAHIIKGR